MKEYMVTLHRREDLDDFYNDMETPGGDLYIPDRAVDLQLRRKISRVTNYMLTVEEAEKLKEDPRVRDVEDKELFDLITWEVNGYSESGSWRRDSTSFPSSTEKNWGIYRHTETTNPGGDWGRDNDRDKTADINITASGKNVDVLIVDGSIVTAAQSHPEFAVNPDGTGGSRVQAFNWFSLTNQLGLGSNGTYDYDTVGVASDSAHGCHVAGTVAGNTKGWARDANIYNIEFYYANAVNQVVNSSPLTPSTLWDYIREWHNTKPINPVTGRRNPTISNHSYGGTYTKDSLITNGSYDSLGALNFRGSLFNAYGDFGRGLTDSELEARGVNVPSNGNWKISSYSTSLQSDIEDAIDDGIMVCISSGNHSQKSTITGDQDFANLAYLETGGTFTATFYTHRGDSTASGDNRALVVGNLYDESDDKKSPSSVCGNIVDIHAAGSGIVSSVYGTGNTQDSRNSSFYFSKYSGTSMASPQVSGVLALLAESNPGLNQEEANDWLNKNGTDDLMQDTGTDDCTDFESLQGAANKILRWINQRPENGLSFPKINTKARPNSGRSWPRPRIRVRG
jgi:hypothetical protein